MATSDFLPFATGGGANVLTQAQYLALAQVPTGYVSGVANSAALNKTWRQSSIMSAVLAQFIANQTGANSVDDGTTATLLANLIAAVSASVPGVVGQFRNLSMSVTAASAAATLTADEIIVESALGGLRYCLASFSKTINLATTGAGGMDTGTAPVSGYVALYAIYNPTTQTSALLAKNAATLQPNVYGGANMPAGYTASALVGVWPTNASSLFKIGIQRDRNFSWVGAIALSSATTAPTFTSLSIASVIPANAISVIGQLQAASTTASNIALSVAADANATGQQSLSIGAGSNFSTANNFTLDIITPQTIFYSNTNSAGTPNTTIFISRYSF